MAPRMIPLEISRRSLFAAPVLAAAAPAGDYALVQQHDQSVENYLRAQVSDRSSRWFGRLPDATGLHHAGTAAGALLAYLAAFHHPLSRFHQAAHLRGRIQLSADALAAAQTPDGNFDLLITNFNSPPDTGFIVHLAASAACLARNAGDREAFGWLEPMLRHAGDGMRKGGVHTPNHRWVVCAALAQLHELFPEGGYVQRIDQWLAESIDLDADGQFSERSTLVYNPVVCSALVVMAHKLNRPALLDPVRRNLESLLYLLEPGAEAITDISRRQDQYQRSKPQRSWFALRYLANRDGNGQFAALADLLTPNLPAIMEYPELAQPGPPRQPLPEDYEKLFPSGEFAHIRRGTMSAHILLKGHSRFLGMRRGGAAIPAVRAAAAFFGKGQFRPAAGRRQADGAYVLEQTLDAGYYQPLDPPRAVAASVAAWRSSWPERKRTEVCKFACRATIRETPRGIRLRFEASGTRDVPVALEINFKAGGKLAGVAPAPDAADAYVLPSGFGSYTLGEDTIRFGPGLAEHRYTQVRGAEPRAGGPSVYLCGYAPFDHTVDFDLR